MKDFPIVQYKNRHLVFFRELLVEQLCCFRRYRFTDNSGGLLRAARMIIADYLKIDQKALKTDYDCNTAFVIAFLTKIDFQLLWRYFSWANQSISKIALWIGTVYLYKRKTLISSH
jgi:carbon starvation protein CstA